MSQPTPATPWKRANTDWFMKCRWGLFAHYLADTASNLKPIDLTVDDWNRRVDAFDVDGLARQLAAAHVPYFIITLGQNSGFYISPNRTYDEITGIKPSKCSRRDLIADLNGIGGGFMSQLEWGSDRRGLPLPVADAMESLFNSGFQAMGTIMRAAGNPL